MLADGTMGELLQRWNYYYSGEAETLYREVEAHNARRVSLMLSVQVIGLGVLAIQAQRCLKEVPSLETRILGTLGNDKWPGCRDSKMPAAARRTR